MILPPRAFVTSFAARVSFLFLPEVCYEDCCCLVAKLCLIFATSSTVAHQAPESMGFSRQECWSGLPFPWWVIIWGVLSKCQISVCYNTLDGCHCTEKWVNPETLGIRWHRATGRSMVTCVWVKWSWVKVCSAPLNLLQMSAPDIGTWKVC